MTLHGVIEVDMLLDIAERQRTHSICNSQLATPSLIWPAANKDWLAINQVNLPMKTSECSCNSPVRHFYSPFAKMMLERTHTH